MEAKRVLNDLRLESMVQETLRKQLMFATNQAIGKKNKNTELEKRIEKAIKFARKVRTIDAYTIIRILEGEDV